MRITLSQAIADLRSGKVIAVPTETVYGLAARIDCPAAIQQIFNLKGRPITNPLIIHVADLREIDRYVLSYPSEFEQLARTFWPGSLTCILPVNTLVPELARAGLPSAGFRIPDLKLTRDLLKETGPLVMPSANLSGRPSATRPEHVEDDFGADFPILDGGICQKGVESTILLYQENEWVIVRLGALSPDLFKPVLGYQPRLAEKISHVRPLCPGQLFRHYAPQAHLELNPSLLGNIPFILGFKERRYPEGKRVMILGSLFHPEEVAENLYQALRQLDQEKASDAWVDMDFPREGLWLTIAERLTRAAE